MTKALPSPFKQIAVHKKQGSWFFSQLVVSSQSIHLFYATYVYTLRSSGVRAKYSLSMSPSILFLMTTGLGRNRARNCCVTCRNKTQVLEIPNPKLVQASFDLNIAPQNSDGKKKRPLKY